MRRVAPIEPTPSYEDRVRTPGEAFLARCPNPTRAEFRRNDFWTEIHDEMYDAYGGICMYCASWTPRTPRTGSFQQTTIDHFMPKGRYPQFAYQWSNFRLCRSDINTNKGEDIYVPDPFDIQDEWFEIDFTTWRVGPSRIAPEQIKHRIRSALVRLGLNEDAYIEERQGVAAIYVHRPGERAELEGWYPFLVAELVRQSEGTELLADLRGLLDAPVG